jgi:hypothetical protein
LAASGPSRSLPQPAFNVGGLGGIAYALVYRAVSGKLPVELDKKLEAWRRGH